VLMTAAVHDELSRTTLTAACCRRAETITLLRFAGAVRQEPGRCSIELDLATPLGARRLGMAIRTLYGYPTQLHLLPTPGYPAAPRHRLRMTRQADAAALVRRTGLADPRGRLIHGLPADRRRRGVRRRRDLAGGVPRRRFVDRTPPVPRTRHHLPQPGGCDGPGWCRPPPGHHHQNQTHS